MNNFNTEKLGIPIIFVHNGNQTYFKCVLEHAVRTQPNSRIIVLSSTNKPFFNIKDFSKVAQSKIEIFDSNLYFNQSKSFENKYEHMSPNSKEFELICFQRWFIISEFVNKHNIEKFFCCDSDNLVFSNLTDISEKCLDSKEISIINEICPCCTFFTNSSITKFCDFILKQYTNSDTLSKLHQLYNKKIEAHVGGICDMTMFPLYEESYPNSIKDLGKIQTTNGITHIFDDQISNNDSFIEKGFIKKIKMIQGFPYGFLKELEVSGKHKRVLFDNLHCQGKGNKYFTGKYGRIPLFLKIECCIEYFSFKQCLRSIIPTNIKKILKKLLQRSKS